MVAKINFYVLLPNKSFQKSIFEKTTTMISFNCWTFRVFYQQTDLQSENIENNMYSVNETGTTSRIIGL